VIVGGVGQGDLKRKGKRVESSRSGGEYEMKRLGTEYLEKGREGKRPTSIL